MAGLIEKRQAMHRKLKLEQQKIAQLEAQVDALEPLANIGMISAMIAHEINNILTPLGSYAELAMSCPDDAELTGKALKKTLANTQRASKTLNSMLAIAKGKSQKKQKHALGALLDAVFDCMARDFTKDCIQVRRQFANDLQVNVEANLFQQVLMNLFLNARQAMLPNGGNLTISAGSTGQSVQIVITDTGCGIPESNLEAIFEPFFTTSINSAGPGGSGLGLAFCKRVIEAHNGTISVDSAVNAGTSFKILLPNT